MISEGCVIGQNVQMENTVIGIRSIIQSNCDLKDCVVMGNDHYETGQMLGENEARGLPHLGIGAGCVIRETIIDKNVQIGEKCVITPDHKPENVDHELYCIRDGIVVVPKNTIIPAGTVI